MYILSACKECGFVWATLALALECARIDKQREEMKRKDLDSLKEHFRVESRFVPTDYPK